MATPTSITADGSVKAVWVPAIADTTAPTVAEVTAGTAVDLSCYLTPDGLSPSTDEQSVTDDRLCSRQTFEKPGRHTDGLEIMYVYQGQDLAATDNEAQATLTRGTAGFVVLRWGQDYEDALVATDVVDVMPVTCGVQRKQPPEANGVLKISQKLFITDEVQRDVAVAA